MGIGFILIFLLKAQVSYLTILKRKNLSFKLKQTGLYLVWFYQNVSLCQNCILTSDSEANRDGADASLLFHCLSLFLPHSLIRKGRNIVFVLLLVGRVSPLQQRNIIFFSALTRAARAKKKKSSDEAICSRHQRALSRFWARLRILNFIGWLCQLCYH